MDWVDRLGLFREPEGPGSPATVVGLGLVVLGIYGYVLLRHSRSSALFLAWAAMFFLPKIPHSLPSERTTLTGVLRIVAILYAITLGSYVIFLH